MFYNHLIIAIRNFTKQKFHNLINLLGLAMGLASAICIFLFVNNELAYDTWFDHHEDVYALSLTVVNKDGGVESYPVVPGGWPDQLKQEVPEIVSTAKIDLFGYPTTIHHKRTDRVILSEDIRWATPEFFQTLGVKLIKGNAAKALSEPNDFLVSQSGAKKLFGTADPINEVLTIKHPFMGNGEPFEVVVTGIYEDLPDNVHLSPVFIGNSYAMRANFASQPGGFDGYYASMGFNGGFFQSYVRLQPGASTANLEKVLTRLTQEMFKSDSSFQASGSSLKSEIHNLTTVHFDPETSWEFDKKGDRTSLSIFSSIAVLILVIASINYMNLATARSAQRAKEVGMRKALGATRFELAFQFLKESAWMTLLALLLSLLIVALILPYFNTLTEKNFTFYSLFDGTMILTMLGVLLFVTLAGGAYPAFFLSGFKPVEVLKGRFTKGKGAEFFRRSLVGIQFMAATIMLIATGIILKQMDHMQKSKLNSIGEQIISIRFGGTAPDEKYQPFKNAVLEDPEIEAVTMANHLPRMDWFGPTNARYRFSEISDNDFQWHQLNVDFDFPQTYHLELVAGRSFDPSSAADSSSFLINESAMKALNKSADEVLGLSAFEVNANQYGKIIGVVKDFPFQSAYHKIEPLVINPHLHRMDKIVYVKVPLDKFASKIEYLETTWKKILPGVGFDYWFLDDEFSRMYKTEKRVSSMASGFSVLALIITALGLYGLASYTTAQKTKEVGIRKVMGATTTQVILMFLLNFMKVFFIALLVAVPVSWYLGDSWLNKFVYRQPMEVMVFVESIFLLIFIIVITVAYETYKAATSNPVTAIRHE